MKMESTLGTNFQLKYTKVYPHKKKLIA